jgi:hypothetical protein
MTGLPKIIFLFASFLLGFQLAHGQTVPSPELMAKQADLMIGEMEELTGRLQLTDAQDKQLRDILKTNGEQMRTVMQEHNIKPGTELSFGEKMSLARDMRPIKEESNKKIEAFLSPDQMNEFEKIRKETRDEIKARHEAQSN